MKLFVIGATGRTGQDVVQQALARDHHVTAFVRSPENIRLKNERLTVLKGDAMDENELFGAVQNHDAVVSTLLYDLSKPRRCRSPDGFQSVPQSGDGVHARRDRTKETFSQDRGYREITYRFLETNLPSK